MINYSHKSNDDDGGGGGDGNSCDPEDSRIFFMVTRPVFQNERSSVSLSSFIANCARSTFFISARSIHLIERSLEGYIQFSERWKENRRHLDFTPLERMDEYHYLPEEIEEEIIVPSASSGSTYHDNNGRVVERKVISYTSHLPEENKRSAIVTPHSFDKDTKRSNNINSNNDLHSPPHLEQKPEVLLSDHKGDYKSSAGKSIDVIERRKEKSNSDDDYSGLIGKNKPKSQRAETQPKIYSEKQPFQGAMGSKEKEAGYSKLKSTDRMRRPIVNQSPPPRASTQSHPTESSNQSSVSRPIASLDLDKKELFEQGRSTAAPNSLQAKHIDKTVYGPQKNKVEEKKNKSNHAIYSRKPSEENFRSVTHQQRQKIDSEKISNRIKSDEVLTSQKPPPIKKNNFSKLPQLDNLEQSDDRASSSSITESLNLLKHLRTSSHDNPQVEEARNKQPASDNLTAEMAVSNNNNNNNNKNSYITYENNQKDIPNIRVNRLDIRVVGNTRPRTSMGRSGQIETGKSTDELDHYDDEQSTTLKSLNKSYLWKYKVRLP